MVYDAAADSGADDSRLSSIWMIVQFWTNEVYSVGYCNLLVTQIFIILTRHE